MTTVEQILNEMEASLQPLRDAEARALELRKDVPDAELFVALSGITYDEDIFDILPDFLTIRSVTNPPGVVHVCSAADHNQTDYLGIARYSHSIKAEIVCGNKSLSGYNDPRFLHHLAWNTSALLKLQGHQTLFCPGSSTVSWDTIASVTDESVAFLILDDVPRQIQITESVPVTDKQLVWVREYCSQAMHLQNASTSRRFGLAFNLAYTWNHTKDYRIALASIWSGLEALFGKRTDRPLSQRLVERITAWNLGLSEELIHDLYSHRCDAVHGRWMRESEIIDIIRSSADLLTSSLIRSIELNDKTLPDWDE